MSPGESSARTYLAVFAALLALTALTTGVSFVDLGPLNAALALAIAGTKGWLVAVYFMHLRGGSRVVWVFAATGFFWLGILIALTFSDYLTRGWRGTPADGPYDLGGRS
jgi:cytochrome c oxidase subunit 4